MKIVRNRIAYIDFIKVFLTCMVVAHHAGQAYGNTGGVWLVSDNPKLDYLKPFFFFNASYMMGLYFFISGYFIFFSLHHKSIKKYLKERFSRLLLPLLFFAFCIFGPLHYFLSATNSDFFTFMVDLHFNHPPLSVGHLWFVASLLAYSIIYLLLVQFIKIRIHFTDNFRTWYPMLYLLFLIPVNVWVRQTYPLDYWVTWLIPIEVAHLPQYLSLFFLGALFNKTKWLDTIKPITAFTYLLVGLVLFFSQDIIYKHISANWSDSIIESFLCVGLCLGLFSIFKLTFHSMNGFVKFISDNSYGIYLFHLLLVIVLQLLIAKLDINTNIKFIIVTFLGILFSGILTSALRKIKIISTIL